MKHPASSSSILLAFLFCLTTSTCLLADIVGWHDSMSLTLGAGVDLSNQKNSRPQIAIMDISHPIYSPNTGERTETITFAQHQFDVINSLEVNQNVSLNDYVFSGSTDIQFADSQSFTANKVDFVYAATRDFGQTNYTATDFTPDFKVIVTNLQQNYQGQSLHDAITALYGAYYVRGFTSKAKVVVTFSFQYQSQSLAQSLSVNSSASANLADFLSFSGDTFVSKFFSGTQTGQSLTYQFYSTDPFLKLTDYGLATAGGVQSFADFTNLIANLRAYVDNMDPKNAKLTGYILDPIQNLPGYLPLLGGYSPTNLISPDYAAFMKAYSQLIRWSTLLSNWILNPSRMSWLNAAGQQLVKTRYSDVEDYLAALKTIAQQHFTTGSDLQVPSDILNYVGTLSDIPIPTFYFLNTGDMPASPSAPAGTLFHIALGFIDCGSKDLTTDVPFGGISEYIDGSDSGIINPVSYSPEDFYARMTQPGSYGNPSFPGYTSFIDSTFTGTNWAVAKAESSTNRILFFADSPETSQAARYSLVIRDNDNPANTVDQISDVSSRTTGTFVRIQSGGVPLVKLSAGNVLSKGGVGVARTFPITVTNAGQSLASSVALSFALDPALDFGGGSGSQGYASFDPTSRLVSYTIGPLLSGTKADLAIRLVPLRPGLLSPSSNLQLFVGPGSGSTNGLNCPPLSPLSVNTPTVGLIKRTGSSLLQWQSDTDKLIVQKANKLGDGGVWQTVTNWQIKSQNNRFLSVPDSSGQTYFRLRLE